MGNQGDSTESDHCQRSGQLRDPQGYGGEHRLLVQGQMPGRVPPDRVAGGIPCTAPARFPLLVARPCASAWPAVTCRFVYGPDAFSTPRPIAGGRPGALQDLLLQLHLLPARAHDEQHDRPAGVRRWRASSKSLPRACEPRPDFIGLAGSRLSTLESVTSSPESRPPLGAYPRWT
jgi:hypothetical protein